MGIQKVMVIGAGQMGSGIAQVCAMSGYEVLLHDLKDEYVEKGLGTITKNLSRQVEKGKMESEEKDAILSRLTSSTDLKNASCVDLVIEAAVENMEIKTRLFAELDEITPRSTSFLHPILLRFRLPK